MGICCGCVTVFATAMIAEQIAESIKAEFRRPSPHVNGQGTGNGDVEKGLALAPPSLSLPQKPRTAADILSQVRARKSADDKDWNGKVSGTGTGAQDVAYFFSPVGMWCLFP